MNKIFGIQAIILMSFSGVIEASRSEIRLQDTKMLSSTSGTHVQAGFVPEGIKSSEAQQTSSRSFSSSQSSGRSISPSPVTSYNRDGSYTVTTYDPNNPQAQPIVRTFNRNGTETYVSSIQNMFVKDFIPQKDIQLAPIELSGQQRVYQPAQTSKNSNGNVLEEYADQSTLEYQANGIRVIRLSDGSWFKNLSSFPEAEKILIGKGSSLPTIIDHETDPAERIALLQKFQESSAMKSAQEQATIHQSIEPSPIISDSSASQMVQDKLVPVTRTQRSKNSRTGDRYSQYSDGARKTIAPDGTIKIQYSNSSYDSYTLHPNGDIEIAVQGHTIRTNARNYEVAARSIKSRAQIEALVDQINQDITKEIKLETFEEWKMRQFEIKRASVNRAVRSWNFTWNPPAFSLWFDDLVQLLIKTIIEMSSKTIDALAMPIPKITQPKTKLLYDSGVSGFHAQ